MCGDGDCTVSVRRLYGDFTMTRGDSDCMDLYEACTVTVQGLYSDCMGRVQ